MLTVLPYLTEVLLVFIDLSVIPVFAPQTNMIPISLAFAMAVSMLYGPGRGIIAAVLGGFLSDTLGGSPFGSLMIIYAACALISGLLGYESALSRQRRFWVSFGVLIRRIFGVFFSFALISTAVIIYQYFSNAFFEHAYITDALIKCLTGTLETVVLYYLIKLMTRGRSSARVEINAAGKGKQI